MNHPRMSWNKLLSTNRLPAKNVLGSEKNDRSEFEIDIDRIMFSGCFRKLSRKTQVHPMAANDYVHTRLTHSLEVAQVGRTLGKAIGKKIAERGELPSAITPNDVGAVVQAACLAHDLGNPPFGHGGEEGMSHWFELNGPAMFGAMSKEHKHDIISFEGNAQGFRIVTQLENHLFDGGLRLTYATLGAFLKYPWTSRVPDKKFGVYISEEKILEQIAEEGLGLLRSKRKKHTHDTLQYEWSRHPLAFLVEAADDICYGFIDLEDAVELKILTFVDVVNKFMPFFDEREQKEINDQFDPSKKAFRINLARLRGRLFDKAISGAIEGFMKGYDSIMEGRHDNDLFYLLDDDDPRKKLVSTAKAFQEDVFLDQKKVEIELGCYSTFETLLEAFCKAALESAQCIKNGNEMKLGWKSDHVLKLLGDHAPNKDNPPTDTEWSQYQCLRRVIDFVSGMTDNYATYIASQLQGMGFSGMQRP